MSEKLLFELGVDYFSRGTWLRLLCRVWCKPLGQTHFPSPTRLALNPSYCFGSVYCSISPRTNLNWASQPGTTRADVFGLGVDTYIRGGFETFAKTRQTPSTQSTASNCALDCFAISKCWLEGINVKGRPPTSRQPWEQVRAHTNASSRSKLPEKDT